MRTAKTLTLLLLSLVLVMPGIMPQRLHAGLLDPDLSILNLTLPLTVAVGDTALVTNTVVNLGGGAAPASTVRFYISEDPTITESDIYIGARDVEALLPLGTSLDITALEIPVNLAEGVYYIGAVADALGQVVEDNELNNIGSGILGITALPELNFSAFSGPGTANAGDSIVVANTVRNEGMLLAGASRADYYLSTDTTITAGDTLIGTRNVPLLLGNGTSADNTVLDLPAALADGTYHVGAIADAGGAVVEAIESNNTTSYPITVSANPELSVDAVTFTPPAEAGDPLAVGATIRNSGHEPAGSFLIKYYLSADAEITEADTYLCVGSLPSLAATTTAPTEAFCVLPDWAAGDYYLGAIVDAGHSVAEGDEDNNTGSCTMTVTGVPDLTVSALTGPASAQKGTMITLANTVANGGGVASAASSVKFYLSSDEVLQVGADTLLATRACPEIGAGAVSSANTAMTLPATPIGALHVLAVADANEEVAETQEVNNKAVLHVTVTETPPVGGKTNVIALSKPTASARRFPYRPAGATLRKYTSYRWVGYINPRHAIGGHAVYISLKKYVRGRGFVHLRRYTATNYKRYSITQYQVSFPLGPGRYKLIPVSPEDTFHNRKVGTESYYTVR